MEEGDLDSLERCMQAGLLHGSLDVEKPEALTLNNLMQFAQLAQLGLQWLHALHAGSGDQVRPWLVERHSGCKRL